MTAPDEPCAWCREPLDPEGPSEDWCSEECARLCTRYRLGAITPAPRAVPDATLCGGPYTWKCDDVCCVTATNTPS